LATGAEPTARAQAPAVFGAAEAAAAAAEAEADGAAEPEGPAAGAMAAAAPETPGAADDDEAEDEDEADSSPLAPTGRTNAATAVAVITPATTETITAKRRPDDPGLRCPPGASCVLISAGLYWARSHGVTPKIFADP
jgi:hypothetical protein